MTAATVVRLVDIRETPSTSPRWSTRLADAAAGGLTPSWARSATTTADGPSGRWSTPLTRRSSGCGRCERVAREYDVRAVAGRATGRHPDLGDAAVVVATAADHRGMAFEASWALIDELKSTVPIWKHQLFADGSDEWVGTP